tara:strand:+ start:4288 stop:4677 length:390 start_codon:yes stop_codon:yes gene_type:complete
MTNTFNIEIISPDKTILSAETSQVTIPAFEGLMTILKDHISLITFLRPGFLEILTTSKTLSYYIEEGTVEFYKNKLLILSSTVKNKKNFSSNEITKKLEEAQKIENNDALSDKEKYKLSYKIDTLKKIK